MIVGLAIFGAMVIAGMGFLGCHKPPMFCGGGLEGKDFPVHVLEKIDSEVKALELTEAQKARYEEIRSKIKNELTEVGEKRKVFFEKVKAEMDKEKPDLNALSELLKAHLENFPIRAGMFIDDFMAFYEILDENQKSIITDHLKDKFTKFEAFNLHFAPLEHDFTNYV